MEFISLYDIFESTAPAIGNNPVGNNKGVVIRDNSMQQRPTATARPIQNNTQMQQIPMGQQGYVQQRGPRPVQQRMTNMREGIGGNGQMQQRPMVQQGVQNNARFAQMQQRPMVQQGVQNNGSSLRNAVMGAQQQQKPLGTSNPSPTPQPRRPLTNMKQEGLRKSNYRL